MNPPILGANDESNIMKAQEFREQPVATDLRNFPNLLALSTYLRGFTSFPPTLTPDRLLQRACGNCRLMVGNLAKAI